MDKGIQTLKNQSLNIDAVIDVLTWNPVIVFVPLQLQNLHSQHDQC